LTSGPGSDGWSRRLLRWYRAVAARRLLLLAVLVIAVLASQVRGWLVERGLRDEVSVAGTVRLYAASMTPVGGSVNFTVAVHNTGPRTVRITGVDVSQPRLRVRGTDGSALRLAPEDTGEVAVSVRLDCTQGDPFVPNEGLRATIDAIPLSGRRHRIDVSLERASLITNVANTMCRVRPDHQDAELSGPILAR
jgi:hypothetical protein